MPNTNLVKMGAALGAALALVLPAIADAATTPAAPATPPTVGGLSFTDPTAPTVFADGSTLSAPLGEILGDTVEVTGTLAGTHPGDGILIERLDATAGWVGATTTVVKPDGTYDAVWHSDHAGRTTVRAVPSTQAATATTATAGAEGRALTVYRKAKVTWYGPGFYGKKTACGHKLTHATLGVANKTLPCGTLVDLFYEGNTVTVPVIDRGPYRAGTNYDLTSATAEALGVRATTTVGAVSVPPAAVPAAPATPAAAAPTAS